MCVNLYTRVELRATSQHLKELLNDVPFGIHVWEIKKSFSVFSCEPNEDRLLKERPEMHRKIRRCTPCHTEPASYLIPALHRQPCMSELFGDTYEVNGLLCKSAYVFSTINVKSVPLCFPTPTPTENSPVTKQTRVNSAALPC